MKFIHLLTVALQCLIFFPKLRAEEQPAAAPSTTSTSQWQACGWGGGGYFWACAFHPSKDGVIYLGGDVNGVCKSEDHGQHWRLCNRGLTDFAVYSLATDALHPDTVYAATTTGVCKSTDAGEHWEFLETTSLKAQAVFADRNKSVRALAVDPQSGDILAGTPRGQIFKSTDGGHTWKKLYELKDKGVIFSVAVSPKNSKALLAASNNAGLLLSNDGGETWSAAAGVPKDVRHAAFAPNDDAVIYAACGKDGIWKSTDHGQTWSASSAGIDPKSSPLEVVIDRAHPEELCAIAASGWNGTVYTSSDAGKTWTAVHNLKADSAGNPTLPHEGSNGQTGFSSVTNLAANPNNAKELFIAANWRNAWSGDGGKTWEERDHGADISCITDIRFFDGKAYATVMDEGLLASDDNGASWKQLFPLKYTGGVSGHHWRVHLSKSADGATHIVSATSAWDAPVNNVLVSNDGGKTFSVHAEGLPKTRPKKNTMWGEGYARALAADPKNPQLLYLGIDGDPDEQHPTGGGVFKSTDGGATWKQLAHQPGSRRMFYGLSVDPTDAQRLFWGACGDGGGLYRSEDGGESWTLVFKNETWIFNMGVAPNGAVYCCGNNLWRSTDHGATWTKISDFKENYTIIGLEFHPKDEKTLWISRVTWSSAAQGGVFKTTDGGATWQDITGDLPSRKPLVLRFNPDTSELWAGNVGLFKLKQ